MASKQAETRVTRSGSQARVKATPTGSGTLSQNRDNCGGLPRSETKSRTTIWRKRKSRNTAQNSTTCNEANSENQGNNNQEYGHARKSLPSNLVPVIIKSTETSAAKKAHLNSRDTQNRDKIYSVYQTLRSNSHPIDLVSGVPYMNTDSCLSVCGMADRNGKRKLHIATSSSVVSLDGQQVNSRFERPPAVGKYSTGISQKAVKISATEMLNIIDAGSESVKITKHKQSCESLCVPTTDKSVSQNQSASIGSCANNNRLHVHVPGILQIEPSSFYKKSIADDSDSIQHLDGPRKKCMNNENRDLSTSTKECTRIRDLHAANQRDATLSSHVNDSHNTCTSVNQSKVRNRRQRRSKQMREQHAAELRPQYEPGYFGDKAIDDILQVTETASSDRKINGKIHDNTSKNITKSQNTRTSRNSKINKISNKITTMFMSKKCESVCDNMDIVENHATRIMSSSPDVVPARLLVKSGAINTDKASDNCDNTYTFINSFEKTDSLRDLSSNSVNAKSYQVHLVNKKNKPNCREMICSDSFHQELPCRQPVVQSLTAQPSFEAPDPTISLHDKDVYVNPLLPLVLSQPRYNNKHSNLQTRQNLASNVQCDILFNNALDANSDGNLEFVMSEAGYSDSVLMYNLPIPTLPCGHIASTRSTCSTNTCSSKSSAHSQLVLSMNKTDHLAVVPIAKQAATCWTTEHHSPISCPDTTINMIKENGLQKVSNCHVKSSGSQKFLCASKMLFTNPSKCAQGSHSKSLSSATLVDEPRNNGRKQRQAVIFLDKQPMVNLDISFLYEPVIDHVTFKTNTSACTGNSTAIENNMSNSNGISLVSDVSFKQSKKDNLEFSNVMALTARDSHLASLPCSSSSTECALNTTNVCRASAYVKLNTEDNAKHSVHLPMSSTFPSTSVNTSDNSLLTTIADTYMCGVNGIISPGSRISDGKNVVSIVTVSPEDALKPSQQMAEEISNSSSSSCVTEFQPASQEALITTNTFNEIYSLLTDCPAYSEQFTSEGSVEPLLDGGISMSQVNIGSALPNYMYLQQHLPITMPLSSLSDDVQGPEQRSSLSLDVDTELNDLTSGISMSQGNIDSAPPNYLQQQLPITMPLSSLNDDVQGPEQRSSLSLDEDTELNDLLSDIDLDSDKDPAFQPDEDDCVSDSTDGSDGSEIIPIIQESVSCNSNTTSSETDKTITVKSFKQVNGKKCWDKKHYCCFCEKPMAKLPRHYMAKHSSEKEVSLLNSYSPHSQKAARQQLIDVLRKRGDFNHNCKVIESGSGEIVTRKSTTTPKGHGAYLPCEHCFGFYFKRDLYRHIRSCPQKPKNIDTHVRHQSRGALLLPSNRIASSQLNSVMRHLIVDEISLCIQNDDMIIGYGEKLLAKFQKLPHMEQIIRTRMRELGRLLLEVRKTHKINSLADCLCPKHFSVIVNSVRSICGFAKGVMTTPSLALKLGQSLCACARIQISKALRSGDEILKMEAENFLKLHDMDWASEISISARNTLEEGRWNKPNMLPLTEDILKFQTYLKMNIEQCLSDIKNDQPPWRHLCQLLLASVILFNRRRSGEVDRIELETFKCVAKSNVQPDIIKTLCPMEQSLISSLSRVEIRGKRGRKVPILLTDDMLLSLNILISSRKNGGICAENRYMFANNALGHLRGHDTLKQVGEKAGIQNQQSFTSTRLRKHIATFSQVINLKDHELDLLATFMGHDVRIHRNYYRLPEDTLQLAKVGRLLLAANNGTIAKYAGKSLDDITIDEKDAVDSETPDEDSDDSEDSQKSDDPEKDSLSVALSCQVDVTPPATVQASNVNGKRKHVWTTVEKAAIERQLGNFIRNSKTPGKRSCLTAIKNECELQHFRWQSVKFCCYNIIKRRKKQIFGK